MKTESFSFKGYSGSSEFSHEDRCLVGQILYIDDLMLYEGDNYEDLEKAFQSSVDEYLKFCKEIGKEPQKAYSGHFNIRIGADLHANAARQAIQSGVSLNEYVRQAVRQKTEAPAIGKITDPIAADAQGGIFPSRPIQLAGTATGSGPATFSPSTPPLFLGQERPMLLTTYQLASSHSETTNVVASASKKPTLRRVV